ncbi:MAG: Hsp70 family protein [Clostridiales bacterium]|nr:Hsp70 family protein [Clostridiales bacterium]
MAIIGIDLGTTNSLVSVYRDGRVQLLANDLGQYMTPSCVSLLEDSSLAVGTAAKNRLISHPKRTAASFKTWMGTEREISLGDRTFLPHELSALVLKKLLQGVQAALREPVEEAIISVPAYFNDNQRCATKLAAQLAGVPVKRLINEPSAAALYHSYITGQTEAKLMIIDFGGGTLDVSVVDCFEHIIEIVAIAGNNRLGGNDIDRAIAAYFCQETGLDWETLPPDHQAQVLELAETAKIKLSHNPTEACILILRTEKDAHSLSLTASVLREICQPIFEQVRQVISQAIKDSDIPLCDVDDVVLVGGSSQLGVFVDYLEELFFKRPTLADSPEHIVALGVGLCVGIKQRAEELQELVMTDVCPFSLGIATCNTQKDTNPHMATLIPRSTILPARHTAQFITIFPNQRHIKLEVYQGENYYAADNLKLGEITVSVPPDAPGAQGVMVTFAYDINGILAVVAESSGGDKKSTVILNPKLNLSQEELQQVLEKFEQLRLASQVGEEDQLLLDRAKALFAQLTGRYREEAGYLIRQLETAIQSGSLIRLNRERKILKEKLNALEAFAQMDVFHPYIEKNEEEKQNL